ncbi:carboxypeptidase-like regulatory domain-containing protein [Gaoshiqia sp. Z1-71]|uniref:carboxypeptidase-like regulatory domain-containing protein n=1 Tax=Gaoshiqia hydrogeniformans TaxID=3290090 RepID=UPI003BF871BB
MERLFGFLWEASVAVGLFYLLYWLLLRKSTHFQANRFFLLITLLLAMLVSAFPVKYAVPVAQAHQPVFLDFGQAFKQIETAEDLTLGGDSGIRWAVILCFVYFLGVAVFALRLVVQCLGPVRMIYRCKSIKQDGFYLHETSRYQLPFSFFNHIFINPNNHKQEEINDILTHEQVHIRERHWVDLLFIELFTVILWFNPVIWLFEQAIKQNHEYLADKGVLTRGHSPVRYQVLLINQLMGMQVIGITNSLTFALGPTRLNMMTKQKTPKKKLLRMACGIPVLAVLLIAFAEPELQPVVSVQADNNAESNQLIPQSESVEISGRVMNDSGDPLQGASVIIKGTTVGTVTDKNGAFSLRIPEKGAELFISFVGYETIQAQLSCKENYEWKFQMKKAVIGIDTRTMFLEGEMPPPPPPPAPPIEPTDGTDALFIVVEELPKYPNGFYGLGKYVKTRQKELKEQNKDLSGKATVGFTVNESGEVTNIQVLDKTTDASAKALMLIVSGMEKWSPGKQRGRAVPVNYAMELEF